MVHTLPRDFLSQIFDLIVKLKKNHTNFLIVLANIMMLRVECLKLIVFVLFVFEILQGSADSNYSQPSSDLSLDEEKESLRREKERQALTQLEKARVSFIIDLCNKMEAVSK